MLYVSCFALALRFLCHRGFTLLSFSLSFLVYLFVMSGLGVTFGVTTCKYCKPTHTFLPFNIFITMYLNATCVLL